MVAYEFLVLAAEQITQKLGLPLYPVIWYLYLPGEAFSSMGNYILQMLPIDGWLWPWAILSSFFPFSLSPSERSPFLRQIQRNKVLLILFF